MHSNKKSIPRVAQLKTGVAAQSVKRPSAPPVYRPQPVPRVLQTKKLPGQNSQLVQAPRQPVAPPVYRPEHKKIVQPKVSVPQRKLPTAPPVYRPEQKRVAQPKMATVAQQRKLLNSINRPPTRQVTAPAQAPQGLNAAARQAPIQRKVVSQAAALRNARTGSVVQLLEKEAAIFIKDNDIEWKGKISKKKVVEFSKDVKIDAHLRQGLVEAWNVGATKAQSIHFVSDDVREEGRGSHLAKLERETRNKLEGDKVLGRALDLYHSKRMVGPVSIEGFRLCRYKKGLAVAVSRSTGKAESKAMKKEHEIQRMAHKDPYKWFSESSAHTEKFVNNSESDVGSRLVVWIDASVYLEIRSSLKHEYLSSGVEDNRFHQENVSGHAHLINIGIHGRVESIFNRAIVAVSDLEEGEEMENVALRRPPTPVPDDEQLTPEEEEAERLYQLYAAELGYSRS